MNSRTSEAATEIYFNRIHHTEKLQNIGDGDRNTPCNFHTKTYRLGARYTHAPPPLGNFVLLYFWTLHSAPNRTITKKVSKG